MNASNKPAPSGAAGRRQRRRRQSDPGFYTPFAGLDQYFAPSVSRPELPVKPAADQGAAERNETGLSEDDRLFAAAMAGIERLPADRPQKVPRRGAARRSPPFLAEENREVLAHLHDLVEGDGWFELTWSDEYVDGAVVGLSPTVIKRLRRGEYSYQAHLDLHGCTRVEALALVQEFVIGKQAQGLRCVLIICGRGLNSKDRQPVLKEHLVRWLTRSPLKGLVLAFSCARAYDGGAGAFYVLLRRSKGRRPVLTPAQ